MSDKLRSMRYAGSVNRDAIELGFSMAKPGVALRQIDAAMEQFIKQSNCKPAFKRYQPEGYPLPFPATACISPNDVVVHGIPGDYILKDGDLLTIDVGTEFQGFYVDAARSNVIKADGSGSIYERQEELVLATEYVLAAQLSVIQDGCDFLTMIKAAEEEALGRNVHILPHFGGHFIGESIHMDPYVPSTLDRSKPPLTQRVEESKLARQKLSEGQTICVEPVVTFAPSDIMVDEDQWTVRLASGDLAAHTERCLLVTKDGYELLS